MSASPQAFPQTVLITGGTSALGEQMVRKFLASGAKVFFTYLSSSDKAQALESIGAHGYLLDLASISAIDAFATDFQSKVENLHVLIHNAAAVRDRTLSNLTEEDWDYVLTVNLKAPYYLTKKLMPYFLKRRKAAESQQAQKKIFFITSRAAQAGGFGISNYAASKAGINALMKSLAAELGKREVLVNSVNPGFMKSRMTELLPEEVCAAQHAASPLHKGSDPAEVADFVVYLASPQVTQVTGQIFHFESRKIS